MPKRQSLPLLVSAMFFVACGQPDETDSEHSIVYRAAELSDGAYTNSKIGISFEYPTGWTPWTPEQIREKIYQAALAETGDEKRARLEGSDMPGSYQLLTAFKYESETSGRYNPSIVLDAKSKEALKEQGIAGFEEWLDIVSTAEPPRRLVAPMEKLKDSSIDCWYARVEGAYPNGMNIFQDQYNYEIGDYFVRVIISTDTKELAENLRPHGIGVEPAP